MIITKSNIYIHTTEVTQMTMKTHPIFLLCTLDSNYLLSLLEFQQVTSDITKCNVSDVQV